MYLFNTYLLSIYNVTGSQGQTGTHSPCPHRTPGVYGRWSDSE